VVILFLGLAHLILILLLIKLWSRPINQFDVKPHLSFQKIELQTQTANPFKLMAASAEMNLNQEWEMSLRDIQPFFSGDFSVQPEEILFIPKSGRVILKRFDIPNLIDIDEVIIDPATNNVSFYDLRVDYLFSRADQLHWENWELGRLKSRDLLQHWSRLMTFFQDQKNEVVDSALLVKAEPHQEIGRKTKYYRVQLGELSLHQSILHFRIGAKDIKIETPDGLLESASGRLKLNPLVLTTAAATLNQSRKIKRASFDLKTGELKLE
jgi:hypothetical protein